jgi:hypothetical protein
MRNDVLLRIKDIMLSFSLRDSPDCCDEDAFVWLELKIKSIETR